LDEDDGSLIWSYKTSVYQLHSSPAVADGKIFIGSYDNKIYCFGEKSTPTPAPTPIPSTPSLTPTQTPTLIDSDGDGVPDQYDYDPYDPNVQTKSDTKTPGFEAIFVIAGLLAVTYLLRRRR